jgi:hypothetical protein
MSDSEINDFILKHLPYSEKGKKDGGEVFTSSVLIEKMLDELPLCVWSNPCLKWLEPTCGVGNFMVIVYRRLMNELTSWESDHVKRSKHIIRNMLYMVEINNTNVEICASLFGTLSNIRCSDVLLFNCDSWIGVDNFDIILGNLPFQSKSCVGGKSKLYEKITIHCLQMLKTTGYMLLITPDNIFSGGSKVYKELLEHQIMLINLDKQNQNYFRGIQQYICYFLLCKFAGYSEYYTKLVKNDGVCMNILLKDRDANPVRNWTEKTEELICKYTSVEKNNIVYNRGKSLDHYLKCDFENAYSLIYTPSQFLYTSDKTLFVGGGIKKIVVFSISPNLEFKADLNGEYGVGPNTFFIPVSSDKAGQLWVNFLGSDDYKTIALATKTNRQFLKNTFLQHLICPK